MLSILLVQLFLLLLNLLSSFADWLVDAIYKLMIYFYICLLWKWRWIMDKVSFESTTDAVFWVSFIAARKLSTTNQTESSVPLNSLAWGWWVHDLVLLSLWGSPLTPSLFVRSCAWINPVDVSLRSTFALIFWGWLSLSQFFVGFALNCLNFWVVLAMKGFFLLDPYFHLVAEVEPIFLSDPAEALQFPITLLVLVYKWISFLLIE